jgi:hypothetical protein
MATRRNSDLLTGYCPRGVLRRRRPGPSALVSLTASCVRFWTSLDNPTSISLARSLTGSPKQPALPVSPLQRLELRQIRIGDRHNEQR